MIELGGSVMKCDNYCGLKVFFYTVSCEWLIHRFRGSLFVQKGSYRDDPWIQWDHWMAEWGITGKKSLLDVPPESSPEWMSPECQASSPDHRFKYCSFHVPLFQPEITITNGQIDRFVQWHGLMVWNQLNDIQCRFCSIEAITWSKEVASTCNIYPSIINVSLTTTKKPWLTSGLILESAYEEYPEVVFYFLNPLRLNGNGMSWSLVLRFRNWPKSSMQNIIYIPIFLYFPIFSYGKSVNPPCFPMSFP